MRLLCARPGCSSGASAQVVYDVESRRATLVDPGEDGPMGALALCTRHAEHFGVPSGWELHDERTPLRAGLAVLFGAEEDEQPLADPHGPLMRRAFRVVDDAG